MIKNIYNIDFFGAKYGKKLPKYKRVINTVVNRFVDYLSFISIILMISFILFIIIKFIIIVVNYPIQ